jgi:hypothetical protein
VSREKSISDRALFIFDRTGVGMFDIRRSWQFIVHDPNTGRRAMGGFRTKRTDDQ